MKRSSTCWPFVLAVCVTMFLLPLAFTQETTGGLQGTIKDSSGAVIGGAHLVVTGTSLVGSKELDSESTGYYRFANLPPGTYSIDVSAKGFKTAKLTGISLEVGHLPTLDITLEIGTSSEVVEVSGQAPVIDVTTNTNQTNISTDVLNDVPHGRSFQSLIQLAPMARNEPLAGYIVNGGGNGGTGGSLPGSSGNGNTFGYSVGGASDSESSYLVEGQDTEQLSGGYSKANVPYQFIQEVQIKTSGIEAEHGGALGAVVNVVMKKGANSYHGELFTAYETSGLDANNNNVYLRYDPTDGGNPAIRQDPVAQNYSPRQDHIRILQPGFTLGGPIMKDRLWFFAGFAPQINTIGRTVDFSPSSIPSNAILGRQYFTSDSQQYYTTSRLDFVATSKIRLFASWLYQYQRLTGNSLPVADPVNAESSYLNTYVNLPIITYQHGIGFSAPNATYNFGGDITLTPQIVSTTRFGYFFENYHDFGWQTSTPNLFWLASGSATDNLGLPMPQSLQIPGGTQTAPYNPSTAIFNANKHYQFDEDVAFFKSGWAGTHNIKVGYQLNHLVNQILQNGNVPLVYIVPAAGISNTPSTVSGAANCNALATANPWGFCAGQYGYAYVNDFSTILPQPASDWNHAFFVQDSWTVGHGLTLNLGLRVEKESLPVPAGIVPSGTTPPSAISFSWSDKIEPRLGAAWGSRNGKIKIFGSYGVVNDVMKLLLAQTSWGAQAFEKCYYALGPDANGTFTTADIDSVFVNGRACPNGPATTGANFAGGVTPQSFTDAASGVSLIENINLRPWEPVAPGVKPYRQHEYVAGVDYQLSKNWAFEARYDRRRLDHILEDASLADPNNFEMYTIVNPGEGVNKTIDGYANYLQSLGSAFGIPNFAFNATGAFGTCPTCPNNPKAIRNYDGVEIRVTKAPSKGLAGMFSYTWSSLWGNYTGLTTTDQIDGGAAGRNSPDTTRAFDEPFLAYSSYGKLSAGPLPTDRPNTFKGNVYYSLPWKGMTSTFGIFQYAYQGSPMSSSADLFLSSNIPFEDAYLFGRGKWVNMTTDPATGDMTLGNPYSRRTPWYVQTDFNIGHSFKVNKNNDHQVLGFDATITNLFNQHSITQYWQSFNSNYTFSPVTPSATVNIFSGAAAYQVTESPYNVQQWVNGNGGQVAPSVLSSWYGKPYQYQGTRTIRLTARFTF